MKILQIGHDNWANHLTDLPEDMEWYSCTANEISNLLEELKDEQIAKLPPLDEGEDDYKIRIRFDGIIITEFVEESDLSPLISTIEAYALFYDKGVKLLEPSKTGIFRRKILRPLEFGHTIEEKVQFLQLTLFGSQYGAKLKLPDIDVNPNFKGKISYDGHVCINMDGFFGDDYTQLFTFRYNLSSFPVALEIWLEYVKHSEEVSLQLEVQPMRAGSLYDLMEPLIFSEEDMETPIILEANSSQIGYYSISVLAKGQGRVSFGPLHWRYSRMGLGRFVLGGQRFNDEKRQEFIYYFNPGDMKPPLNVYFSGFRTAEGFEGFGIMKSLKSPFMLIGDPRLEGGGFYIGSDKMESAIVSSIQDSLDYLGFEQSDLILSGLSMGTFGALYYASDFNPYGVVVGKPFTNIGDTVAALKLKRPDEFETSADVLLNNTDGNQEENIIQLNEKFWTKFSQSNFSRTHFAIAYMENDDYDGNATKRLINHLSKKHAHIYAKGYEGRHNDNSRSINKWFMRQYVDLIEAKYERKYE